MADVPTLEQRRDLSDRLIALANELIEPMLCTQPGGGVYPGGHCAACCYGTLLIITCQDDQDVADTAKAMEKVARMLYPRTMQEAAS